MAAHVQNFMRFLSEDYFMSDEFLGAFVPIVVYWVYSGIYMLLLDSLENYRLHPRGSEELKNTVSKTQVVKGVLVQQTVQTVVVILIFALIGGGGKGGAAAMATTADVVAPAHHHPLRSLIVAASQFFVAMVVMDTYQYFTHWYLHQNKFLYRHIHAVHHRIVVTHAFGALYGHAFWDGIIDTVGSGIAFYVSGMSQRTAVLFFAFSVMKVIDDHCGMWLPGNPFHLLFWNNSAFQDFHHQLAGSKYNFSQPFFISWDKIMGTYMPVTVQKRAGGPGFVIVSAKDLHKDA